MALVSESHLATRDSATGHGFGAPDTWNWKSDSDDPDLRDVVVVTDQTLFVTRYMSSDAARKLLMAAAESDLAVTARAASSQRRITIPLTEIVEVSFTRGKPKALLHTSSGRAANIDLPNDRIAEELCEAIATKAGYGKRTVTDLGRPPGTRPLAPSATSAAICCAIAGLYIFDPDLAASVPAPGLLGSCAVLVGLSAAYALEKIRFRAERVAITVDRRRRVNPA